MYTETKNNFSIRDVILQFLFIALFVFILIWLFPMKSDLNKAIGSIETSESTTDLSLFYDKVFNENVIAMKESAKSYYTTSRLPQKNGESVSMTLGEMLEAKIILPFVDKDGKQCSLTESYVKVTKGDEEYVMKVNLKCGKDENYLLVHMGCYDYCEGTICEKNKADVSSPKVYQSKTKKVVYKKPATRKRTVKTVTTVTNEVNISNKIDIKNEININNKIETPKYETLYEYKKITDGTSSWTDWSEWSKTKVTPSENVQVKYQTRKVKKLVAYKKTTSDDLAKPIEELRDVVIGETNVTSCSKYNVTSTITGYTKKYLGTFKYSVAPSETEAYTYERVGNYSWYCDGNCTAGTVLVYRKYQKIPTTSTSYSCAKYNTEKSVYIAKQWVVTGYEKKSVTEPVYETSNVKYYSYRTKTSTPGTLDIKWSIYNDTTLLNNGYMYTGNTKTIIK